jgi:hypothetical protein
MPPIVDPILEESPETRPRRVVLYRAAVVLLVASTVAVSVILTRLQLPKAPDENERTTRSVAAPSARPATSEDMNRRRAELMAIGQSIEQERVAIEDEKREVQTLRRRIESRRRQYPGVMPPAPATDDQFDVTNYNHRMTILDARVADYNARLARFRQDLAVFEALEHPAQTAR